MLSRIDRGLLYLEKGITASLLIVASVILFANVVGRYVFSSSMLGAEELVRYMIVWLVFVGGSLAARNGIHIGVDAFLKFLPGPMAKALSALVLVICIVFCVAVAYYAADYTMKIHQFGQRSSALRLPFWIAVLAIPVGTGLMAIRFTQRLIWLLHGERRQDDIEHIG